MPNLIGSLENYSLVLSRVPRAILMCRIANTSRHYLGELLCPSVQYVIRLRLSQLYHSPPAQCWRRRWHLPKVVVVAVVAVAPVVAVVPVAVVEAVAGAWAVPAMDLAVAGAWAVPAMNLDGAVVK